MLFNNIHDAIDSLKSKEKLIIIPVHDNPDYTSNILNFFKEKKYNNIIILNNKSRSEKMIKLLESISKDNNVVFQDNHGPRQILNNSSIFDILPENFILTDPDMGFRKDMPSNFYEELLEISEQYSAYKVGAALNIEIEEDNMLDNIYYVNSSQINVRTIESAYYSDCIGEFNGNKIYSAPIDTTFCLYNKKYGGGPTLRVAGKYLTEHYGWYTNPPISKEDVQIYLESLEADVVTFGGLSETVKKYGGWKI